MSDEKTLDKLHRLFEESSPDNLGDNIEKSYELIKTLQTPMASLVGAEFFTSLMRQAVNVDFGWKLFKEVDSPTKHLTDAELIQLLSMSGSLFELRFCFDAIDRYASFDNPTSTPIRFFINSICHYASALFLLDLKNNKKLGLSVGGSLIRVLKPLGLDHLLASVFDVLKKEFGGTTLGETIRLIRNNHLVHNNFLPEDISELVIDTQLNKLEQKIEWNMLLLEFAYEILILRMKLKAIIEASGRDVENQH